MEKNTSVATLQILGGRPSLDFANTVAARRDRWGPDVLADYRDLVAWAERVSLVDGAEASRLLALAAEHPATAAAALERAKALRESIYAVFSALAERASPDPADLDRLATAAAEANARQRLGRLPGGGFGWVWDGEVELDAIAQRVALDAADLLVDSAALPRVKECHGRNCGWLFLDQTRNGRRRWCSDAECGTVDRVARYRSKVRAKVGQP